jgi:hypothetical protein
MREFLPTAFFQNNLRIETLGVLLVQDVVRAALNTS